MNDKAGNDAIIVTSKDQSAQIIPLSGYPASNFVNKVHPKVSWYLSELREG